MATHSIGTGYKFLTINEGDSLLVDAGYSYEITDARVNYTSILSEFYYWPFATPEDFLSYDYTTGEFDSWPKDYKRGDLPNWKENPSRESKETGLYPIGFYDMDINNKNYALGINSHGYQQRYHPPGLLIKTRKDAKTEVDEHFIVRTYLDRSWF